MKVFIPYSRQVERSPEGLRLRKTLKGECESVGISWVDRSSLSPDAAHLFSLADEAVLVEMKWRKIPCVVSVFYAENDPFARFSEKNAPITPALSNQAIRYLNKADLVLAPNDAVKGFLVASGVTSPIEVHSPSINLARFAESSLEREIFPRYYSVRPEDRIVVSAGAFSDKARIAAMVQLAKLMPDTEFYYFGCWKTNRVRPISSLLARTAPKNLHFKRQHEDDIYRSALMRANAYLNLDPLLPDTFRILEAFAAKTPVVTLGDAPFEPLLQNKTTCLRCETIEEVAKTLGEIYSKEAKSTIIAGYRMAENHSLASGGKELASIYRKYFEQN